MKRLPLLTLLFLCCALFSVQAQEAEPATEEASVARQLQALKKEVIALNRDLFVLEEDLLFPSSTQIAVYISMDVGTYFKLDALELKIDDESVSSYLYTDKQVDALYRGGVQKLFVGNIPQGEHQISAFFTGMGPENRPYKRGTSFQFNKDADAKSLQLSITDSTAKQQPEFTVIEL